MYCFASHPFASFATGGPSSSSSGYAPCRPSSSSFTPSPFGHASSPRYVYQDDSHAASSDDDDDDDDLDRYYEYLDAARRAREHKKLEEAQAHRHAQEQVYLRAKAQAEHEAKVRAAIEARQRYEAQQEREYRRRQHQAALEYWARQEAEYRARQQAEVRARKEAEYRIAMDAQARACAQAQAKAEAQQEQKARQAEAERIRRIQAAYQEDLLKHLFGSYTPHQNEQKPSAPATHPSSVPKPSESAATPASQAQPQVERRPSVTSDHSSSSSMSREEAVTVIQTLAKQQINLRRRIGTVKSIRSRFETLKAEYQGPDSLIFNADRSTPSAPVLAYTPTNRPLQAYEEDLTRLLTELDEISSQGSDKVKKERKALATDVQKELDRLDGMKVVEWARQTVQQPQESMESLLVEAAATAAAPMTIKKSGAADAPEVAAAVEPIFTIAATTAEAASEQTADKKDDMEVDALEENGSLQELPVSPVQVEDIETASAPSLPAVDVKNAQVDHDTDANSAVTEPLLSDPIDAHLPAPTVTQESDLQLDPESTTSEPQQAPLEHTSSYKYSPVETDPHPSASTSTAADNLGLILASASDAASNAEQTPEKPNARPFSIPGLISQIVRESYEDTDEEERQTAEDEMRSESSGSETSFEML